MESNVSDTPLDSDVSATLQHTVISECHANLRIKELKNIDCNNENNIINVSQSADITATENSLMDTHVDEKLLSFSEDSLIDEKFF